MAAPVLTSPIPGSTWPSGALIPIQGSVLSDGSIGTGSELSGASAGDGRAMRHGDDDGRGRADDGGGL